MSSLKGHPCSHGCSNSMERDPSDREYAVACLSPTSFCLRHYETNGELCDQFSNCFEIFVAYFSMTEIYSQEGYRDSQILSKYFQCLKFGFSNALLMLPVSLIRKAIKFWSQSEHKVRVDTA